VAVLLVCGIPISSAEAIGHDGVDQAVIQELEQRRYLIARNKTSSEPTELRIPWNSGLDRVSEDDLRKIQKLATLRQLELSHRSVTDEALEFLKPLVNLRLLSVSGSHAGQPHLNRLRRG
jgi:hypothetical protein